MADKILTTFENIVPQSDPLGLGSTLYIDANTFNNFFRLGIADYLVRTGREIVFLPEVTDDITGHGNTDLVAARLAWIDAQGKTVAVV
jgi:hypothetical protein